MRNGDDYGADVRRLIGDAIVRSTQAGFVIDLQCCEGHTVTENIGAQKMPPEAVNRRLCNKGWKTGKRLSCPEHAHQRKEKPVQEPTKDAKKVHRAVMEALMIAYDEDKKAYSSGYTDQKIADETGAAVEYVRKTRDDYFGPLAEPGELAAIRKELSELFKEAGDFATSVVQMHNEKQREMDSLTTAIKGLETRLNTIAVRNGWA